MADYVDNLQAVVRVSTSKELMPPPAKRIKRPPKVLDEDTYTNALVSKATAYLVSLADEDRVIL